MKISNYSLIKEPVEESFNNLDNILKPKNIEEINDYISNLKGIDKIIKIIIYNTIIKKFKSIKSIKKFLDTLNIKYFLNENPGILITIKIFHNIIVLRKNKEGIFEYNGEIYNI